MHQIVSEFLRRTEDEQSNILPNERLVCQNDFHFNADQNQNICVF